MVLLLVVGLAAVIAVILIAVILSVRLGRHDDEEPEDGPSERGHGRADAGDPRRRDTRTPRTRPQAQDRRYRDRDNRRPEHDQPGGPGDDYDYPQQRPSRRAAPAGSPSGSRRPSGAGPRQPGSGRDNGGRRTGSGRDRHEATPAPYDSGPSLYDTGASLYDTGASLYDTGASLYDTGTSPRLAADDFLSEPLHAADFPSAEFASRPQPAADFPSGEFPYVSQHPADAPMARYRAAPPRSGEFPSGPLPVADLASEEFTAADFASEEFPAADFPSEEMPSPSTRGRAAPSRTDPARGRTDSRRRPALGPEAKKQDAPRGRSRQSRKRDDDDWPSMEGDKLTDEQYWAELSSDKPLATTARSAKPAGEPMPAAKNGQPRSVAPKPKPPAVQAAPAPGGRTQARDVPARTSRPSSPREPAPAREPATLERAAVPAREPVARSAQEPVTHGRPRQQPAARPDSMATPPAVEPSIAMLASLGTGPNMVPHDDPLTSPSFSRPATDSRSYRTTRNSTQPGDTANGAHLDGPPAAAHNGNGYGGYGYNGNGYNGNGHNGNGHGGNGYPAADYGAAAYASNGGTHDHAQANGTYQLPSYDDPGHGYLRTAPAGPATTPATAPQPADWYSAPKPPPSQGNPYGSFVEPPPAASYPSIAPAGYQDQHPGAAVPAYPDDHDRYQEPVYDAVAQMYTAPIAAAASRPTGAAQHRPDGGQFLEPAAYPAVGYPQDNGYGDGYGGQPAYANGYGNGGYPAADYSADQYGQDEYDGYPADQG